MRLQTQQRYILREEVTISKTELSSVVNSLHEFSKTFDKASKFLQFPLRKPKTEIGYTKSKDNLFAHYYNDIIEHVIDKFFYGSDLETTILVSFPTEKLKYTVISIFLQKLSILAFAKLTMSPRTDNTLQTSLNNLRTKTMCSVFTSDCGYENSFISLIGDVFKNTKCSGEPCLHKKTFQSLGRSDYQCPQGACVCQVPNIPHDDQTVSYSCRLVKGFTFLKTGQNQLKMFLEMPIVVKSIVSAEKKSNPWSVM